MGPQTVLEAITHFSKTEACQKNPKLINNLRTALRRSLALVHSVSEEKLRHNLDDVLTEMPLFQFLASSNQLLQVLDVEEFNRLSSHKVSSGTIKNYYSALARFLEWTYAQGLHEKVSNLPIEKFAPQAYSGQTLAKARRGEQQLKAQAYALKEEDLTDELKDQLNQFQAFGMNASEELSEESPTINSRTLQAYRSSILCILGWLHNIKGITLTKLSLKQVTALENLEAFIDWGIEEKGNTYGWALNIVQAALAVVRLLPHLSNSNDQDSAIQKYLQNLREEYHREKPNETDNSDALTYEEGIKVIEYLKECCAPRHLSGALRSEMAVLKSWQRYLITSILFYCPVRQNEIRQLGIDQLLIDPEKRYWIQRSFERNRKVSGAIASRIPVPPHLSQDLDVWITQLRPKVPTNHNFVFTRLGSGRAPESLGKPLSPRDISDLVSSVVYRATSVLFGVPKQVTLHNFRQATATYLAQMARTPQMQSPTIQKLMPLVNQQPYEPMVNRFGIGFSLKARNQPPPGFPTGMIPTPPVNPAFERLKGMLPNFEDSEQDQLPLDLTSDEDSDDSFRGQESSGNGEPPSPD